MIYLEGLSLCIQCAGRFQVYKNTASGSHLIFQELRVSWGKKVIEENTVPLRGQSGDTQKGAY